MTQAETSKVMKVVPERDGHRVELQWAVPPESKAYKVFPCSYLRYHLPPPHPHPLMFAPPSYIFCLYYTCFLSYLYNIYFSITLQFLSLGHSH